MENATTKTTVTLVTWTPMDVGDLEMRKKALAGMYRLDIFPDIRDGLNVYAINRTTNSIEGMLWRFPRPNMKMEEYDSLAEYLTRCNDFAILCYVYFGNHNYHMTIENQRGVPALVIEF